MCWVIFAYPLKNPACICSHFSLGKVFLRRCFSNFNLASIFCKIDTCNAAKEHKKILEVMVLFVLPTVLIITFFQGSE